jgi:hypothetical protein
MKAVISYIAIIKTQAFVDYLQVTKATAIMTCILIYKTKVMRNCKPEQMRCTIWGVWNELSASIILISEFSSNA